MFYQSHFLNHKVTFYIPSPTITMSYHGIFTTFFFFSFLHRKCKCFLEVTWSHRFFSFFFLLQIIKMSRCYLKVGYYGQLFINVGAASGLIQNYIICSNSRHIFCQSQCWCLKCNMLLSILKIEKKSMKTIIRHGNLYWFTKQFRVITV